jgi:hypothetical protein
MGTPSGRSVWQALIRANELRRVQWHCGPFSAEGNTLGLCAYPARYLVFRGTRFVQLPFRPIEPEFSATEEGSLLRVLIRSQGKEFFVLCEDVAFYDQIEYPQRITSVWNEPPEQ